MSKEVYEWFERERGIRKETLDHFKVRVEKDRVIFPYIKGEKARPLPTRPLREGEKRFYFTSGMTPGLYNIVDAHKPKVMLTEGESDTLRLWQELRDAGVDDVGVVGISGANTWNSAFATALTNARIVYAFLDNDDDYMVVDQVNRAWRQMRSDLGKKARRVRLPDGVKDVCEFFDTFDLDTLRMLCKRNRPGKSRFRPLDLTKPAPPPNWLIEGLIAKGDFTILAGREGLGKSWFTMLLSVAIAEGWDEFLGLPLLAAGRTLYVDQENPEDVIKIRLKQLGLTPENVPNLRYLHNEGIRLDRDPDTLLYEALDFEPELIVLDSLTRFHTKEENSVGEMSSVLNEGIQPLARETGAAVIVLHHHNKGGSYRGSTDIAATPDTTIDVFSEGQDNPGVFRLRLNKSRRKLTGEEMIVAITDMPDGSVELIPSAPLQPPF